jgi:ubiquinone biosynthesis protein
MRRDIFPAEYCDELQKLRAQARPVGFEEIKKTIEREYRAPLDQIFLTFEQTPSGSASIAQAHKARLKDKTMVIVKVQRPGIYETMARDIALLHKLSRILNLSARVGNVVDFHIILDELWFVAQQEMDFLTEAKNADEFSKLNQEIAFVTCPHIMHELTTSKILVMEYIDGIPIDDLAALTDKGYDLDEIGRKFADNYIKQIVWDAFFHADPHPGNLRVRDGKIVFIDMGMMGRVSSRDKALFQAGILAIIQGDTPKLKNILLTLGIHDGKIDHPKLYHDIDAFLIKYRAMELGDMNMGRITEEFVTLANEHRISMPKGITLLGRGLITAESVVCQLSPSIHIMQAAANYISGNWRDNFDLAKELQKNSKLLYYIGKKAIDIPVHASHLLQMAVQGQTKVNVEATGSDQTLSALNKMVNKLAVSLIIAALLIGSSLICAAQLEPVIGSIPLIALIGFAAAGLLGIWLAASIWKKKF